MILSLQLKRKDEEQTEWVAYLMKKGVTRKEFDKRAKLLKLDEQGKEELYRGFAELYEHAGFKCAYCNERMELKYGDNELAFTIDHVEARACGGTDSIFNLTFCCQSCNSMKGDKDAGWFVKNVKRLKARKRKREYLKARISSQKDKQIRDSFKDIFQHINAKEGRK